MALSRAEINKRYRERDPERFRTQNKGYYTRRKVRVQEQLDEHIQRVVDKARQTDDPEIIGLLLEVGSTAHKAGLQLYAQDLLSEWKNDQ